MRELGIQQAATVIAAVSFFAGPARAADKMSKEDQHWLEVEVAALLTEEERELFKHLESDGDRRIFKQIFWSRRDPTPRESGNSFKEEYEVRLQRVKQDMKSAGREGAVNDKAKVFLLLGAPSQSSSAAMPETGVSPGKTDADQVGRIPESPTERLNPTIEASQLLKDSNPGLSEESQYLMETWSYNPDEALGIPNGLVLRFRALAGFDYHLILDNKMAEIVERIKRRRIVNPAVAYARDDQGRLVDPEIHQPKAPAFAEVSPILGRLRETGRVVSEIDFQVEVFYFRSNDGSIFVPILFHIDGASLSWIENKARATLMGMIEDESGNRVNQFEEAAFLVKKENGLTTFEMPILIEPGQYVLYLGIRDDDSSRLGTEIVPLDVPAFEADRLSISSILLFTDGEKVNEHLSSPGRAFIIGGFHFAPRLGRKYGTAETLSGVFHAYDYGLEQGKPNLTAQYILLEEGIERCRVEPHPFISAGQELAITAFDIPLSSFEPGDYTLRIKVTDHVRKEVITKDIDFIVE